MLMTLLSKQTLEILRNYARMSCQRFTIHRSLWTNRGEPQRVPSYHNGSESGTAQNPSQCCGHVRKPSRTLGDLTPLQAQAVFRPRQFGGPGSTCASHAREAGSYHRGQNDCRRLSSFRAELANM
eukprot:6395849-Amphidinium_carterae.1